MCVVYDNRGWLRRGLPLVLIAVTVSLAALLLVREVDRPPVAIPDMREGVSENSGTDAPPTPIPERVDQPPTRAARRATVRRRAEDSVPGNPPPGERQMAEREAEPEEERVDIDARDYIAALRDSGATEGLAAFPPPGTRPSRPGVIVPADYVLPEGFARHYQSTDDGRRLAPILTLAPGYELLDDAGDPVPLTDDRIIPPEFAPPDLPVQMLEIPEPEAR